MWSKIRELENEDTIVKMKNLSEKFVVTKARTSSAGSATLGDTSRARLTTELITFLKSRRRGTTHSNLE